MGYGLRQDGTPKGEGYLGVLPRPDGGVSTELSFDADVNGQKVFGPLLVPTLAPDEISYLLAGGKPTESIYQKAIDHALSRLGQGLSPFAGPPSLGGIDRSPSEGVLP